MTAENRLPETAYRLQIATTHAQSGRFQEMLAICQSLITEHDHDMNILLDVGTLLFSYGFLSHARQCFDRAYALDPSDLRLLANLANVARESGIHDKSRRLYALLLKKLPQHPVVRRNALVSLEYDPKVPNAERLLEAKNWGEWAIAQAGGWRPRPSGLPLRDRPLRVAYVSADLCQHTVGLFVKHVIKAHDIAKVVAFAYSAGQLNDWVTDEIRQYSQFRNVVTLDDEHLAALIRQDNIDVLIDLSGHTAGSRLTVFAHRPAPLMVSWLGYFATTGLAYLDAVLLDEWHAPDGMECQFVEPIVRLSSGRFCYQPVPWAPAEIAPLPAIQNGYITFGSFNNTAKYNPEVFWLWTRILIAVSGSRLCLKWRTLVDADLCQSIVASFVQQGIAAERIECRGASFHADVLKEYADIDIALDPFPFTGGLTSCEALWMGVPVVTWPQSRVVSRQTYALLGAIGLVELAAQNAENYVAIAVQLAADRERLVMLRNSLRTRMQASTLMDVTGFCRNFEQILRALYNKIVIDENDVQ